LSDLTLTSLRELRDLLTIRYAIAEAALVIVGVMLGCALWPEWSAYFSGIACAWMVLRLWRLERTQNRLDEDIADMENGLDPKLRRRRWW
jgi:hypothetical protein